MYVLQYNILFTSAVYLHNIGSGMYTLAKLGRGSRVKFSHFKRIYSTSDFDENYAYKNRSETFTDILTRCVLFI